MYTVAPAPAPRRGASTSRASVWHRTPDDVWRFPADVELALACTRYAGATVDEALIGRITLRWTGPEALRIEMPSAALRWSVRLRSTPVTRLFGVVRP